MRGCDFTGAYGVTIHNCNLRESRFVGATIKDSILTDNMMVRCDLQMLMVNDVILPTQI